MLRLTLYRIALNSIENCRIDISEGIDVKKTSASKV